MRRAFAVLLLLAGAACQRNKGLKGMGPDAGGGAGTGAVAGSGPGDGGAAGAAGGPAKGRADLGWGPVQRLTDVEYDNTMRDLLGVEAGARRAFGQGGWPADVVSGDFDNQAAVQNMAPARYQWYFASAVALTDQVWADPAARARIVTCAPASPTDEACARAIIGTFGRRAWRRPLSQEEVDGLLALSNDARAQGADFATAMKQVAVALLVSESFLYRIEVDPDPNALDTHPLSPYELATRLSFLMWSTAPNEPMLDAARAGMFSTKASLAEVVIQMLLDERSDGFVRDFAGQWLGFRALEEPPLVGWPPGAQRAAAEEARRFVEMIVRSDQPLSALLTADANFVDDTLAPLYGFPAPGSTSLVYTSVTTDTRRGYLGLVAPLAQTSYETDTSPSRRGTWVLSRLLCKDLPAAHTNTPAPVGTGRARADMIAASPSCAACHKLFDPIGLGLERFDQLGRYRQTYSTGTPSDDHGAGNPIDDLGALPDGTTFHGPGGLGDLIAADREFRVCVARKAVTYALGRRLGQLDEPTVARVANVLETGGFSAQALLAGIVIDDAFRLRRGEGTP